MATRLAILGATGSIGTSTLQVVETLNAAAPPDERFDIVAISANRSGEALAKLVERHRPRLVAVSDPEAAPAVEPAARRVGARLLNGPGALEEIAAHEDVDAVVHAVVGSAGLRASFAAARAGKRLCLANKESLVAGGELLMHAVRDAGATILPIDSEHSAVFQAMACGRIDEVERIWLTASGGPFRTWPTEKIRAASVEDALAHPTWRMGGKITIDSATLFNKALEIIEAVRLFGIPASRVGVVVHPQSVIHSMVEFSDGAVMAQLSPPDMKLPIGYALTWPRRVAAGARRMNWREAFSLDFSPPDMEKFPSLRLAFAAAEAGGRMPVILNAANEAAVGRFLERRIPFGRIWEIVEESMTSLGPGEVESLEEVLEIDAEARRTAGELATV